MLNLLKIIYYYRNNEAARGLSEFNSSKIEIAKKDQQFIITQDIQNRVFRKYQVAKEMWESQTDSVEKETWFKRMNGWAFKIDNDDYEDATFPTTVERTKSTPQMETLGGVPRSARHSTDMNFNSICSSNISDQLPGSSKSHQKLLPSLSSNEHNRQHSTNSNQHTTSSKSNYLPKRGSNENSVTKQKMELTDNVSRLLLLKKPTATSDKDSQSSESDSDTESYKDEILRKAKKQQDLLSMFREKIPPITAARERIVKAMKDGEGTKEVKTMRDAVNAHHNKLHLTDDTITLLPPDDATVIPHMNTKVSQVSTRSRK